MENSVSIDDVLSALTVVLEWIPVGSQIFKGLSLVYEALVVERSVATHMAPENLKATFAKHIGADVAEILGDRFGKA